MWKDRIVEEIRKYRNEYAKRFNYDLREICHDLRQKQGQDGRQVVTLQPKPAKKLSKAA